MERDIAKIVQGIVELPYRDMIRACRTINNTVDYFEDNGVWGIVDSSSLNTLIRYSYRSRDVAGFLASVLYYVNADVLTDDLFRKIVYFPRRRIRRTFLVAVSHCPIAFYQLEWICRRHICIEAYAQIVCIVAAAECFTLRDLKYLIQNNGKFCDCVDYSGVVNQYPVSLEKREFLLNLDLGRLL